MKTKLILASAIAAMTLSAPALAEGHKTEAEAKAHFDAADTNKDGSLNKAEWDAKMAAKGKSADKADEKWEAADANGDGKVTWAEKKALWDKKHD